MFMAPRRKRPEPDPLYGFRNEEDAPSQRLLDEEGIVRVAVLDAALKCITDVKNAESPLREVLDQAQEEARMAVARLVECDPENPKDIRALQNDVRRFDDLCKFVVRILQAGEATRAEMTAEDAAALYTALRAEEARD